MTPPVDEPEGMPAVPPHGYPSDPNHAYDPRYAYDPSYPYQAYYVQQPYEYQAPYQQPLSWQPPPVQAQPAPPTPAATGGRWTSVLVACIALIVGAVTAGGIVFAFTDHQQVSAAANNPVIQLPTIAPGNQTPNLPLNPLLPGQGGGTGNGNANGGISAATAAQSKGVVTIVSVLKYQNAESAGTGMILTPDGEVLTNNHVIRGATSVTVTVVSNGKSYRADVVGTVPTDDVAVLQLRNAANLATAKIGTAADVAALAKGDKIVGVGNAGGTGRLRAATGAVTALNQTITASDDNGQDPERLRGLIGVDAGIVSGDSGGPMYDAHGDVIGMNTAASTGGRSTSTAYAIPITTAVKLTEAIEAGVQTSAIHIGLPGFIGVGVEDANGQGAAITSVLPGGPADSAGITPGAIITAVNGRAVTSGSSLKAALSGHKPGTSVTLTWTGADGHTHHASVKLTTGPAD